MRALLSLIILSTMLSTPTAIAQTVATPPGDVPSDDESSGGDEPLADICLVSASSDYIWRPRLTYEIGTTIPSSSVKRRRVFKDNDLRLGVSSKGTITVNVQVYKDRYEGDPMKWPLSELSWYYIEDYQKMSSGPMLSPAPTPRELEIGEAINKRLFAPYWYQPGGAGYDWLGPGGYGYDLLAVFVAGAGKMKPRTATQARRRGLAATRSRVPVPPRSLEPLRPTTLDIIRPDAYLRIEQINRRDGQIQFQSQGSVSQDRGLNIVLTLRHPSGVRSSMRGRDEFSNIIGHFNGQFDYIRGVWQRGSGINDNLDMINRLTRDQGMPLEKAIVQTWMYQQAATHGYTNAVIHSATGTPGNYTNVHVNFYMPRG